MDIVDRVANAIRDAETRGLDPDVLVVGRIELGELRVMCEKLYGREDIGGREYQGLKVAKLDIASYVGVAIAQENLEGQKPSTKKPSTSASQIDTLANYCCGCGSRFVFGENFCGKCGRARQIYCKGGKSDF